MTMTLRDLVGQVEIADRLEVARDTVAKWRKRDLGFPPPRITVSGTPIWLWPDVAEWARGRETTDERRQRHDVSPNLKGLKP